LFSSTGGSKPIRGIAKFFNTRLRDQIIANTGAPLSKKLTPHVLRRTLATQIAEILGWEGGTCQLICDTWNHEFREQAGVFLICVESFFGGLIQAAVGNSGGFGALPLKRIGLAANAVPSVTARC
jgi:hypothetical protein